VTGSRVVKPKSGSTESEWFSVDIEARRAERDKLLAETETLKEEFLDLRLTRAYRESIARVRRIYDFVGEVEEIAVRNAVDELNDWAMQSNAPITIRLNSPGGDVFEGFMLFDFIQDLKRDYGIQVITYALGYAASMASILLQAGDRRLISRNSWFMVHEPSSLALGKASDIKDEAVILGKLHKQLVSILAERSTLSVRQILQRCHRKNWWMSAVEAVKYGFADELV